ncbi:hypothetical protein BX661DRAFT_205566 [Kickxella alabastrina]|uniref:uncharacterized protein n=1 Tax=Kickxella alabastrina TaxID=61397 RepID=UPI0022207F48|nr:uncharacterized protein BX661DRAFT_205566 [Kickxella alabastrina]KAI7827257.1 hypothetical protein BX661DRAFT_205566 [Kickxella alabastrina]
MSQYRADKHKEKDIKYHDKHIREKFVSDIHTYVKLGEYGKASELLLIAVENGSVPPEHIWQPLLATVKHQNGLNSLGAFIDAMAYATRKFPPYLASMERIFHDIDQGDLTQASATSLIFTENLGNKLASAHGYRGVLIACMRELDIRRRYTENGYLVESDLHVFKHCDPSSVEFMLTKDDRDLVSKFSLEDAEYHLKRALDLDPGADMFKPYYIQVLIALDYIKQARDKLKSYYKNSPDIHILRIMIAIDKRDLLDQTDHLLEYLERDPFASDEKFFTPFMSKHLLLSDHTNTPVDLVERLFHIVINRIELGEYTEASPWQFFEIILRILKQADHWNVVDAAMELRNDWWPGIYFDGSCPLYKELNKGTVKVRTRCCRLLSGAEHDSSESLGEEMDVVSGDEDAESEDAMREDSESKDVKIQDAKSEGAKSEDAKSEDAKKEDSESEEDGNDNEKEDEDEDEPII